MTNMLSNRNDWILHYVQTNNYKISSKSPKKSASDDMFILVSDGSNIELLLCLMLI